MGIISIYNHLNKRLVEEGDWVKRGQLIGLMGDTGIATGVHLHWGMSVQNNRVSPMEWVINDKLY